MKRILAFTGSNSPRSINRKIIEYAASRLKASEPTMLDLRDYPLPIYSPRIEKKGIPEPALRLIRVMKDHDAYMMSVPEHNGSVPAFFKNTMDWLSRAQKNYKVLDGKPVLLFSTSPGPGGGRTSLSHSETILKRLSGKITGSMFIPKFHDTVVVEEDDIRISDETIRAEMDDLIRQFEHQLIAEDYSLSASS